MARLIYSEDELMNEKASKSYNLIKYTKVALDQLNYLSWPIYL